MDLLVDVMALEVVGLTAGLGLLIGYRLLTGQITCADLLASKELGGLSPVRVQLLLFALLGAGAYLTLTIEALWQATPALPAVPGILLLLVGSSHAAHLGRKGFLHVSRRRRPSSP